MNFKFTGEPAATEADCERRCLCGNLLARLVPGGVELKCRRCKRVVVLPLPKEAETAERARDLP